MKNEYQNDLKELTHSSFNNNFSISISSFDGADSFGHCVLGGGASFNQIPTMRDAMELDKYIDTTQTHMILNSTGGDLYAVTPLTVPFPKIYKADAAIRLINNIAKEDLTIAIVKQIMQVTQDKLGRGLILSEYQLVYQPLVQLRHLDLILVIRMVKNILLMIH